MNNQSQITETEWLKALATNPVFSFLHDNEEDIYTPKDGKPFDMANELLKQADELCNRLKTQMWKAAIKQNNDYFRLETIYTKACRRYERRYRKWAELHLLSENQ